MNSVGYDPDNRFMACAMEYKQEKIRERMNSVSSAYDPDNRFMICVRESRHDSVSSRQDSVSSRQDSVPSRQNSPRINPISRNDSFFRQESVPSHRQDSVPNSPVIPLSKISLQDVRKKKVLSVESLNDFPSLGSVSPLKTPVMPPLRTPPSSGPLSSPSKALSSPSHVALSLKGGQVIQRDIIEESPIIPPLVITPTKWSDILG